MTTGQKERRHPYDASRSRRGAFDAHRVVAFVMLTIGPWFLACPGCSLHFRTWTDYGYNEISRTKRTETLPPHSYSYTLEHREGMYWLRFDAHKLCRKVTVRKVREQAKVTLKAPLAPYYLAIGAVLAACSIPFYYMAAKANNSSRRRNNALTGTFAFLTPGLTLVGFGTYQKLVEGTTTKELGTIERTEPGKPYPCGSMPAKGLLVKVGTKTGTVSLGRTDAQGRVLLPHSQLQPLIRRSMGKIVKVYLDVMIDDEELGELNVPWPLDRKWLRD